MRNIVCRQTHAESLNELLENDYTETEAEKIIENEYYTCKADGSIYCVREELIYVHETRMGIRTDENLIKVVEA